MKANYFRHMNHIISKRLNELVQETDIQILMAVESGSRAWGFESPDSDYDIRIIYSLPSSYYMRIEPVRQDMTFPLDADLLDVSGWELRKALRLVFEKCNASPYEWVQSPICYMEADGFREELGQLLENHFSARLMLQHYLGLAKSTWHKHLSKEEVNLKKYFYALRPVMCALWILERNEVPPIRFQDVRSIVNDDAINQAIDLLLSQKEKANEGVMISRNYELHQFLEESLVHLGETKLEKRHQNPSSEPFNEFLLKWIN